MRSALGPSIAVALGLVASPVLADVSTGAADYFPTRSGTPSTFWTGQASPGGLATAVSGTAPDQLGAASGEPQVSGATEVQQASDQTDYLPARSGRPSTFWTGNAPGGTEAVRAAYGVGAASGEPQVSGAGETKQASDQTDYLPARSGRPSTFWTGSR